MASNNVNVYGDASLWGEQEWRIYVTSHWRSEKSRELHKLGGLGRPAIGRGNSFKMKMEYLGSTLLNQADILESLFEEAKKKGPRQSPTTSLASLSKKHQLSGKSNAMVAVVADGSLSNENEEASIMMRNDVEISAATDGSGASSSALTVIPAAAAACSTIAAWRLRVHQARRRTLLLLVCVFRFRSCLKRKGSSGGGLHRIDSFSYMIPQMLGEDCSKFIAQQKRLLARRDLLVISNGEEQEAGSSDGGQDQPDDDPIRSTSSILMFNIGSSNNIDSSAVARPGSEGPDLSFQQGKPDDGKKKKSESKRCSEIGNQDLQQTNIPAGGILARKTARASSGSSSMAESGSLLVQPTSLTSIYPQGPELMIRPPVSPSKQHQSSDPPEVFLNLSAVQCLALLCLLPQGLPGLQHC
ncbi:hypothetical protein CEUSTIGMA_g3898.t1 [Chlamydomonas eustigma]|uniref:Uncharacterized protein n=1 Tax=Chlamydomonas eustigma TaxID=1157962 RepID=A0A250X045_9CHLO|nr:hypothetical protein CEUSTIGMA_g3898.t1 [Chlamydomonas eustigma]|eukprot:GAX76453.1 hypothetical protein CEUSTIGMA_g3898.t1 [Chlamydomonas eustigma]